MELEKKLIGIRIMQKRKEKGLSQEKLSEMIDISKNHLSSIERGKYLPTTKNLIKICDALGSTPDYYLIGRISSDREDEITALVKKLPAEKQDIIAKMIKLYIEEISK